MLHEFVHSLAPLMWVGVFIVAVGLRHKRRMAEIAYAAQTGQPLPMRGRHRRAAYQAPAPVADHSREVEELRERIRVLERIATSSALENRAPDKLAAEIEALRGQ